MPCGILIIIIRGSALGLRNYPRIEQNPQVIFHFRAQFTGDGQRGKIIGGFLTVSFRSIFETGKNFAMGRKVTLGQRTEIYLSGQRQGLGHPLRGGPSYNFV